MNSLDLTSKGYDKTKYGQETHTAYASMAHRRVLSSSFSHNPCQGCG